MKLRPKIMMFIGFILLILVLISYYIFEAILLKNVSEVEKNLVTKNIVRVENAFQNEITKLNQMTLDWGHWDDTFIFAQQKNKNYIQSNLVDASLINNSWSYFLIFNLKNDLVFEKILNVDTGKPMVFSRQDLNHYFYSDSPIFQTANVTDDHGGLALIGNQLQFVSAVNILHSDKRETSAGKLVIIRTFSKTILKDMEQALGFPFEVTLITKNNLPKKLSDHKKLIIYYKNSIDVRILLHDFLNHPIAEVHFNLDRQIYHSGEKSIRLFLKLAFISSIILLSSLGIIIYLLILKRISSFNTQIMKLTEDKHHNGRIHIKGQDELSSMADRVNQLLSERRLHEKELTALNQKLMIASREAGMLDASTMMLHNIGNILNSLVVSFQLMEEQLRKSKLDKLKKLFEMIEKNSGHLAQFFEEDSMGKKIPSYLMTLNDYLEKEQQWMLSQIEKMNKHLDEVIRVIKSSKTTPLSLIIEDINLFNLINDLIDIYENTAEKYNISIKRNLSSTSLIRQDRFKIWHILNNLMTNAIEALKDETEKSRQIEIDLQEENNKIKVVISDNGTGIAPENLTAIFHAHHTSKKEGSGLGLHSSAIMAKEIKATLNAVSQGPGLGASFILIIPDLK